MVLKEAYQLANELSKNSPMPQSEFEIIIEETLETTKADKLLNGDMEISEQKEKLLIKRFNELKGGRPLQYILGKWEFFGRSFCVGEGVLIPREDTMAAVELCMRYLKTKQNPKFLDLGAGSGCISVTLSKELNIKGYAVEKSEKAAEYLQKNIKEHNADVEIVLGDMFDEKVKDSFEGIDLIVSNPPYITKEDMLKLDENVKREPHEALFGGDDGLDFYREISKQYKNKLKKGGALVFEVGYNQMDSVIDILKQNGYCDFTEITDINAIRRAVLSIIGE